MFLFNNRKDSSRSGRGKMESKQQQQGRPRLERRNAVKKVEHEAAEVSWSSFASAPSEETHNLRGTRSLDILPSGYAHQTSFRIGGSIEGEVHMLCRSLGLDGPDGFGISIADWERHKVRSSSDILPRSRLLQMDSSTHTDLTFPSEDLTSASDSVPSEPISASGEEQIHQTDPTEKDVQLRPDDFGVSIADWERHEVRSSSDIRPSSRPLQMDSSAQRDLIFSSEDLTSASDSVPSEPISAPGEEQVHQMDPAEKDVRLPYAQTAGATVCDPEPAKSPMTPVAGGDRGIRGVRPPALSSPRPRLDNNPPPILKPPPSMNRPVIDHESSTWDIVRSFAQEESDLDADRWKPEDLENNEDEEIHVADEVSEEELREIWFGETSEDFTGTSSYSTMNDDDSCSTTTETMLTISPNGKLRRKIKSWTRGVLLGNGSFGMVYEGMSEEGFFFAVKEVSLLDQGANAQQCIFQLEQEIALLSQFEHENIVQYYGTDKEDTKLFIFLELVTQGSLASLYQKYSLQDSQVSAYTRQILNGLKYLHDRNVVHRDIKCANILVHANGSVKLADFGLAKEMTKISMLKSCKGSIYWMAPEVVNPRRSYGPSADIWSLGCTVLEMLTHQIPYPNLEWAQALFRIGRGEPPTIPISLSKNARDFISLCVKVNPEDRPTASQLLNHPFVMRSRVSPGSNSSSFNNER
ncbi:mitogen-activated protein kinase kinase kinase 1-like [Zingiber officinale]|uniref:mitogen-activated protein kinase kinase kinase 1-like n=1 Tax=Zingiber officinale TaxID=94328 RepID=UPI001C4CA6DA|nr:mitogen-activated protein kinase kinase kinase 1-like [Zingiber officinale]